MTATGRLELITVRHSATAHNAAHIISGRLDEPLSDEGRALARGVARHLPPFPPAVVIASPMGRAIETATIMTGCPPAEIVLDELCVERDYGELQGLPPDEVRRYADRVQYIEVGGIRHSLNPPGGESFDQVRDRAEAFLERVRARPELTAIVFSHQTFLQQLHGLLEGLDVIDSLALDIRTLQVDLFELREGAPPRHEVLLEGAGTLKSW